MYPTFKRIKMLKLGNHFLEEKEVVQPKIDKYTQVEAGVLTQKWTSTWEEKPIFCNLLKYSAIVCVYKLFILLVYQLN